MKKLYSLIAFTVIAIISTTHAMQPARDPLFKLLDQFVPATGTADWNAVFTILQKLVQEGRTFTVNEYFSLGGLTLLCQAVQDGNFLATKMLIEEYGANPNGKTAASGVTPLMIACADGDVQIVKLLLKHGADPFIKNNRGNDSFFFAETYARYSPVKDDTVLQILKTYKSQHP